MEAGEEEEEEEAAKAIVERKAWDTCIVNDYDYKYYKYFVKLFYLNYYFYIQKSKER